MKFCPQCGHPVMCIQWPCTCSKCNTTHYKNPKPVAVAVVPVCDKNGAFVGILGVLRSATTGQGAGKWALPGGHMNCGEDMIEGAIRELREETAIVRHRNDCHLLETAASSDGNCTLVFVLTAPITQAEASQAIPEPGECLAVGVLTSAEGMAFPTHAAIVEHIMKEHARTRPC